MPSPQVVLPPEIAKILPPIPGAARGIVTVTAKGWTRALYYDPITGAPIRFEEPPTIVANAELREGLPPKISAPTIVLPPIPEIAPTRVTVPTMALPTAPTISIPTMGFPVSPPISIPAMDLPAAPTIELPSVALPTLPTIEVPVVTIPFLNLSFPYLTSDIAWVREGICKPINQIVSALYSFQSRANDVISLLNQGLAKARKGLLETIAAMRTFRDNVQLAINSFRDKIQTAVNRGFVDTRDKVQGALNDYRGRIQSGLNQGLLDARAKTQLALNTYRDAIQQSVNTGFADSQGKTQAALNSYRDTIQVAVNAGFADSTTKTQKVLNQFRDNIQTSVNAGLSDIIPKLYEMMGLPIGQLMSPIQIRNVTKDSFEFYSLGNMKLHYIAIGKRPLV